MSGRAGAIRRVLQQKLKPQSLKVEDQSRLHAGHAGVRVSGGGHFSVHIVADCFTGLNRVQRHRLVYEALADKFSDIHALAIHARAPGEESAK